MLSTGGAELDRLLEAEHVLYDATTPHDVRGWRVRVRHACQRHVVQTFLDVPIRSTVQGYSWDICRRETSGAPYRVTVGTYADEKHQEHRAGLQLGHLQTRNIRSTVQDCNWDICRRETSGAPCRVTVGTSADEKHQEHRAGLQVGHLQTRNIGNTVQGYSWDICR